VTTPVEARHTGVAGVLSLIIPGVGQIYNGDFLRGAFWLVVTPGLWIGTGGVLGWIFHLVAAYTAQRRATDKNAGLA
jgi:TM2 domain-containing membrane protein YozV